MQKVEDILAKRQTDSGFAWGTENPTQLDIHFYPHLSRTEYFSGSVWNSIAEELGIDKEYPKI